MSASRAPLSFPQESLWFLHALGDDGAYNETEGVRLRGSLDVAALREALQFVVRRHEMLRTVFEVEHAEVWQAARAYRPFFLPVLDLRGLGERARHLESLARADAVAPFDLSEGPLLRARLLRVEEDEHVLLLTIHHLCGDGWSLGIISREIEACYGALSAGQAPSLSPLRAQYRDYAVWQRETLQGERLREGVAWWVKRLAGMPPLIDLPLDRARPAVQSFRGAAAVLALDAVLSEQVRALGRAHRVTPFICALGALQILLHRFTRMEDFAIGSPFANRGRMEFENLIGFFANTVVLRADLSGDPTVEALLARIRGTTLEVHEHADIPFERVVEALNPPRDLSCNPIFQVMFAWQPGHTLADMRLPGLTVAALDIDRGRAKFDLNLQMWDAMGGLASRWEYNPALFDADTIDRMQFIFRRILQKMVENPRARVSALDLTDPAEQSILDAVWSPHATWAESKCLHTLFSEQAAVRPDAIALVGEEGEMTYGELDRRSDALAHHLRTLGVGVEHRVGMFVERSPHMVVGILGILKAGGAYVPMDPAYPTDRLRNIATDAAIEVLLTQECLLDRLPLSDLRAVVLDRDLGDGAAPPVDVQPCNVAYVIYTSGSTGKPKGVIIEHRHVVRLFEATRAWFEFDHRDVWTLFHSYAFDFSVWELWGALLHGGRLVLVPYLVSRAPDRFHALLCEHRVTVLNQTPSAFQQLSQAEGRLGTASRLALRLVIFGGETLDFHILAPWFARHGDQQPRLVNMYGITETTVHVTYRPVTLEDVQAARRSMIGRPIPDLALRVLDEHLRPVPVGVPGELFVGGAGVARGYLNRPELTAHRFIADPADPSRRLYRSGDLVRPHADGDIEYLGRLDHQVQLRGFRVELGDVESVLTERAEVLEAAAVLREDTAGDRRIVAYVVLGPGASPLEPLKEHLRSKLPYFMVPSALVALEQLPLTPNGKVNRAALPRPAVGSAAAVAPRTPLESVILDLWIALLHAPGIGVRDNFFDVGGNSLLAVRLLMTLDERLRRTLPLVLLFEHPTVEGLAAAIEAGETTATHRLVLQADGDGAPFFCVPGSGGMLLAFRELARRLPGRPFVALGRPGLDGGAAPHLTVEAMAAEAVEAIRELQPHGPYFLGGHSFGAWVAFEIARRLADAGEPVERLAVLDMPAPPVTPRGAEIDPDRMLDTLLHILEAIHGPALSLDREALRMLPADERASRLRDELARADLLPRSGEAVRGMMAVLEADERALGSYFVDGSAHLPIALLRSAEAWDGFGVDGEALGWERLSSVEVDVVHVEGTHAGMLKPPAVDTLARALEGFLTP